ncbi:MAG: hypothetical protein JJU18_07520, partial [Oceanicaulis sp.]|nr:hypothetical protein [Oceanicaulis sp.]
ASLRAASGLSGGAGFGAAGLPAALARFGAGARAAVFLGAAGFAWAAGFFLAAGFFPALGFRGPDDPELAGFFFSAMANDSSRGVTLAQRSV